jgi:hypothetical protein
VTGQPLTTYQRGKLRESDLPWYHTPRIALTTARPRGYLVLPGWPQIERRLSAHGLRVETLPGAIEARVETLRLSEPRFAAAPYQGTTAVTGVKVSRQLETRNIPAGAWVPAEQPSGGGHLLGQAPDSLLAWGSFRGVREEGVDRRAGLRPWPATCWDAKVAAAWQTA